MLFDAQAALAEILNAQPPLATPATIATNHPAPAGLSQVSQVSQPAMAKTTIPPATGPDLFPAPDETCPHGCDLNGNPKTWMGRSVTPAVWSTLTDWERDGSTGQMWNGLSRSWETSDSLNWEGERNDH